MKMQNDVLSPVDGTVKSVAVAVGTQVAKGQVMLVIASSP
jgi:biotin carboxyl carrier protein